MPISIKSYPSLSLCVAMAWTSLFLSHRSLFRARNLAISSYTYPPPTAAAPSSSFTLAYRVFICNLKWASEA